jgi:hypothetical protein
MNQVGERLYGRVRNAIAAVTLIGVAASAAGWAVDHRQFAFSWLVAFAWFFSIAMGALFFVMLQHLTGAAWSVVTRRISENLASAIPLGAVVFLPVAFSLHELYEWTHHTSDPVLMGKSAFLNERFFLIRAAVYFAVWSLFALKLRALSVEQDRTGPSLQATSAAARWSAPGTILAIVTVSLASFDWLMSLEPHWFSTIFGVYVYAGGALAAMAGLAAILIALRGAGVLRNAVNEEHYHDLGKWIFGLTMFWAYIAFSQYLLIWYANLPEETFWFRNRLQGSWRGVAAVLLFGHFIAPFLLLIGRAAKRRPGLLAAASVWMLAMHYVDLYWIAMPVLHKDGVALHWMDAAAFLAVAGAFALAFWLRMRRDAAAPVGDVRFEQSLEHSNA